MEESAKGKKFRVGCIRREPVEGKIMNVILGNTTVWKTGEILKVKELHSDSKPKVYMLETAEFIYVVSLVEWGM